MNKTKVDDRLFTIVRLYYECKQDGIEVLRRMAEVMKENEIVPRNFGPAIRYFQHTIKRA